MKKAIVLVMSALALTACSDKAGSSKNTEPDSATVTTTTVTSAETSPTSEAAFENTDEGAVYVDEDTSIRFDTFDDLIDSDELYSRLSERGIDIEKLSEPVYITDGLNFNGDITMYESCFYAYSDGITVCVDFDKVDDFDGMVAFFEGLSAESGHISGTFTADENKQLVINKGIHTSLYRVTADGLLYSISSEIMTDDELMGYLDKVIL